MKLCMYNMWGVYVYLLSWLMKNRTWSAVEFERRSLGDHHTQWRHESPTFLKLLNLLLLQSISDLIASVRDIFVPSSSHYVRQHLCFSSYFFSFGYAAHFIETLEPKSLIFVVKTLRYHTLNDSGRCFCIHGYVI